MNKIVFFFCCDFGLMSGAVAGIGRLAFCKQTLLINRRDALRVLKR